MPAADPASKMSPEAEESAQPSAGPVPAQVALGLPEMGCAVTCASHPWVPPSRTHGLLGLGMLLTSQISGNAHSSPPQPCSICFHKQNQGAVKKQEAAECLWRSGVCVDVFLLYKR